MAKGTLVQKIIAAHSTEVSEEGVALKIDQTLMQDATGTMVCLELEALGVTQIQTELSAVYIDHNTLLIGPENSNDHAYLKEFSNAIGIIYSRLGNGICHQVHLERFGIPGKILLGADSHTPTNGGLGMLSIGTGGLNIAKAIAGHSFTIPTPEIIGIELTGKLSPWVSAKDVILKVLSVMRTKGNVGKIIEYYGAGVETLTVPERATICNMGTELGVTTSIFPSDAQTERFLKAQSRGQDFTPLAAEAECRYDEVIQIDLTQLIPLAACPSSPDNIKAISEIEGIKVDQVLIGSCTNSSYMDLEMVATLLETHAIHPNVTLSIAPGSKQVLEMLARSGKLTTLIVAGVKILESTCGGCVGQGHSPSEGSVSLRTFNRNFSGRSGTPNDSVYLVSAEIAIVAAIIGKITNPQTEGIPYPHKTMPEKFIVNDNMIIKPCFTTDPVSKKSTIQSIPKNSAFPLTVNGEVLIKVSDLVTTDHIMPAGQFLKLRSNIPEYAKYVFNCYNQEGQPTFFETCIQAKTLGKHGIIVGGESYGQGSSREHAALCPMYLGIKVVIAKSIERIHRENLINFGILPLIFENDADFDIISRSDTIEIPDLIASIRKQAHCMIEVNGKKIRLKHSLKASEIDIISAGGILNV